MKKIASLGEARNGRVRVLARQFAVEIAEGVYERIRTERDEHQTVAASRAEIDHVISAIDRLIVLQESIEARVGASRRRKRSVRPWLRQVDDMLRSHRGRLSELGVATIDIGGKVNLSKHQVRATVCTTDPAQHGRICEVWREGYADGDGYVIRPAVVVARTFLREEIQNSTNKENEQ